MMKYNSFVKYSDFQAYPFSEQKLCCSENLPTGKDSVRQWNDLISIKYGPDTKSVKQVSKLLYRIEIILFMRC